MLSVNASTLSSGSSASMGKRGNSLVLITLLSAMPMVLAGIVVRPASGVLALSSKKGPHFLTSALVSASFGLPDKVSASKCFL